MRSDSMTQAVAQTVLEEGDNAFITGPPGAGKSWLVREFVKSARRRNKKVAITASTGIAGTHVGGTTLHSWAGLGIKNDFSPMDIDDIASKPWVSARVRGSDILIIDEVSMLHPATFWAADQVCQAARNDDRPFGGLQVILCGDFFQLPPVTKTGSADFIYGSSTWEDLELSILYLSGQFRQSDDVLTSLLNAIRDGDVTEAHLEKLNTRRDAPLAEGVVPTRLHTHNVNVDSVNAIELRKIDGAAKTFKMTSTGKEALVGTLRNSCLAPPVLELKEGAAVMFVKNNATEGYINGTLGTVIGFKDGLPLVKTDKGAELLVQRQNWETEDVRGRKIASLTQLPLRLAWAISVHKSQGMSLSAAEIDLSNAFVAGLGYVALSRVTTLEGIRLLGLNKQALAVSEDARRIDLELQAASNEVLAELAALEAV